MSKSKKENVTKERLEKLRKLHLEARSLSGAMIEYIPKSVVADSVTGCTPKRWDKHSIPIKGLDMKRYDYMGKKLSAKTERIMEEIEAIEDWLDHIDDAEMRAIIRMYYSKGMSQREIADQTEYRREGITKKLDRFWKSYK